MTHTHDPNAICRVVDNKKVEFEGEILSISAAAGKVLARQGYSPNVAGTICWLYDGKTLHEWRVESGNYHHPDL